MDEVPRTSYYLIKYVSVLDEGKAGIAQERDGSRVSTAAIEDNITPGATIQSTSSSGTSIELPADLEEGWWFLFVAAATSKEMSDYSEPVYFEVNPVAYPTDSEMAMRWWNVLTEDERVASLFGDTASDEQDAAARNVYADLDPDTKRLVNAAAYEIYGDGGHDSVGAWWETLNCRLMRIATGHGNTHDPSSPFCAHYPGSDVGRILDAESKAHVDVVGQALLSRDGPGMFPAVILSAIPEELSENSAPADGFGLVVRMSNYIVFDSDRMFKLQYGGSATFGVDYIAPETLYISKGAVWTTVGISVMDDSDAEPDETVEVSLLDEEDMTLRTVTLTITDDD